MKVEAAEPGDKDYSMPIEGRDGRPIESFRQPAILDLSLPGFRCVAKRVEIKAGASWDRRDTLNVFALVALAFVLRAVLAAMTPVIGGDAAAYLVLYFSPDSAWSTARTLAFTC